MPRQDPWYEIIQGLVQCSRRRRSTTPSVHVMSTRKLPIRTAQLPVHPMATLQRLSTADDYEALVDKYDTWLFDCDGVLWHGNRLVDGAADVLDLLRARSQFVCTQHRHGYDSPRNICLAFNLKTRV